jgi:hypothetical protein
MQPRGNRKDAEGRRQFEIALHAARFTLHAARINYSTI